MPSLPRIRANLVMEHNTSICHSNDLYNGGAQEEREILIVQEIEQQSLQWHPLLPSSPLCMSFLCSPSFTMLIAVNYTSNRCLSWWLEEGWGSNAAENLAHLTEWGKKINDFNISSKLFGRTSGHRDRHRMPEFSGARAPDRSARDSSACR